MGLGIGELVVAFLGLIVIVSIMSNQLLFALAMVLVAFVFAVFYLWSKREKSLKPLDDYMGKLQNECFDPDCQLGALVLGGDTRHQQITRGALQGYTQMRLEDTDEKGIAQEVPKDWRNLYVLLYIRAPVGVLGKAVRMITGLPIIRQFFLKGSFLIVTKTQLFGSDLAHPTNRLTGGDIYLPASSITTIGRFEFLNTADLDKDVIASKIGKEVARLTLYNYMNNLSLIVDKAIKSDASHEKVKELISPKKSGGYMIADSAPK